MDLFQYTIKNTDEILKEYGVDPNKGLTSAGVKQRLEKYGFNEITIKAVHWRQILLRQFKSPFIYLLIGAAILAFALREIIDAIMILLFLFVNAALGFYQEFRSEHTLRLLKKYTASYVKVMRNGKEIACAAEEIVPGDIIVLETGDKIPADVRFLDVYNTTVDESILTGESAPVNKTNDILTDIAKDYYQALNLGFSGTIIVSGKAKAAVLATGKSAVLGRITRLEVETRRVSSFEKGIARFSSFILKLVLATLVLIFLAHIFFKQGVDFITLTIFSVALAVSVIPEALPVVTTFSLSRGALRLAKKKVVVKRLSAIEDLGGIEILCVDKTGTLTENSLTVAEIYPDSSPDTLIYANLSASSLEKNKLEPFDIALWECLPKEHYKRVSQYKRIMDMPFDPGRRRNLILVAKENKLELIARGAPEEILKLTSNISAAEKKSVSQWISRQGAQGRRVLAVAKKEITRDASELKNINLKEEETGLTFLGVIAFLDPVKPSAFEAVKQAEELGVKIIIITGDSKETAGAVARQIGLVASPEDVINAEELEAMRLPEQLMAVEKYKVFARVSPEQKYNIIRLLQEKYEVGFLGEGINDAPALKIAGVSLVVQSASDIARDAADIVLLQKNLKVILDGIKEGREVFTNTTKYIKATLASNFGNFYAVAIASLLIDYLPMLPVQILLLNLLSDFPMIAISTDTVDKKEISSPKKYNAKDIILVAIILGIVSTVFDFIFFGIFYRISPQVLQTNWFMGSIFTELLLLFSIRSRGFFLRAQRPSAAVIWLTALAFIATAIIPFTAVGQELFKFIRPTIHHLLIIISIAAAYLFCNEIVKLLYYKSFNRNA
jgi:Mg2+-importing ATPase